jgi:hypothetical protein
VRWDGEVDAPRVGEIVEIEREVQPCSFETSIGDAGDPLAEEVETSMAEYTEQLA